MDEVPSSLIPGVGSRDVKLTHDGKEDNDVVLFVLDLIVMGLNDDKGVIIVFGGVGLASLILDCMEEVDFILDVVEDSPNIMVVPGIS